LSRFFDHLARARIGWLRQQIESSAEFPNRRKVWRM
jgi:hypothetical protein